MISDTLNRIDHMPECECSTCEEARNNKAPRGYLLRGLKKAVEEQCGYIDPGQERFAVRYLDEESAYSELYEALEEAVQSCPCSVRERDSGHRVECYAPRAKAALARARGEK